MSNLAKSPVLTFAMSKENMKLIPGGPVFTCHHTNKTDGVGSDSNSSTKPCTEKFENIQTKHLVLAELTGTHLQLKQGSLAIYFPAFYPQTKQLIKKLERIHD